MPKFKSNVPIKTLEDWQILEFIPFPSVKETDEQSNRISSRFF